MTQRLPNHPKYHVSLLSILLFVVILITATLNRESISLSTFLLFITLYFVVNTVLSIRNKTLDVERAIEILLVSFLSIILAINFI